MYFRNTFLRKAVLKGRLKREAFTKQNRLGRRCKREGTKPIMVRLKINDYGKD